MSDNENEVRYIAKTLRRMPGLADRLDAAITFLEEWFFRLKSYADRIAQIIIVSEEMQIQIHTANEQVHEIARELEQYGDTLINILEIVSSERPKAQAIKKATGYLRNLKQKRINALESQIEHLYNNLNQLEVDASSYIVIPIELRNQIDATKSRISEVEIELEKAKSDTED